jgi:hypothetical protein
MKYLVILLIVVITSCNPDFSKAKYKRNSIHGWKRKQIIIFRQGTYRDPNVKKEHKRELLQPKTINLNKY